MKKTFNITNKTALSLLGAKQNNLPVNPATGKMDNSDVAATMLRLSGRTETRIIPAHCAKYDKPFTILYERQSPHHKFQIVKISRPEVKAGKLSVLENFAIAKMQKKAMTYKAKDFDHSGIYCPHCNCNDTFVQCTGCNHTVCGVRIRILDNGDRLFACADSCGSTGKLEACDYINGMNDTSKNKQRSRLNINRNQKRIGYKKNTNIKSLSKR